MSLKLKLKLKSFFKTRDTSEAGLELFRMFILPFMRLWNPEAAVEDAIDLFFASSERKFYNGIALKGFDMPGAYLKAGNLPSRRAPVDRSIVKGDKMLFVIDRQDQTARVDITINEKYCTFLLTRAELEYLKDCIEAKEA